MKELAFYPLITLNTPRTNCETQPLLLRDFDLQLGEAYTQAELVLKTSPSVPDALLGTETC